MHVMLDFETMGNKPTSMVVSLGAVAFTKTHGIVGEQLWKYDLLEQQKAGRTWDVSTLQWWMKQSEDARAVFQPDDFEVNMETFFDEMDIFLREAMDKCGSCFGDLTVWGNSVKFDVSILQNMYELHHEQGEQAIPWDFWNEMCYRTFKNMTKCHKKLNLEGTAHNALDDARYQARCLLKEIGGPYD